MKQFLAILMLLVVTTQVKALDASVTYAVFNSAEDPFIELYFFITGNSVSYLPVEDNSAENARVEVTIIFEQNDTVVKYDKFVLNSPMVTDSTTYKDFIDLKRYSLPTGNYKMTVFMNDLNNNESEESFFSSPLDIAFSRDSIEQSDIQLLYNVEESTQKSVFTKNGLYMEPLIANFYHRKADKLHFYTEIYNTEKAIGDAFAVRYIVEWLVGNDRRRSMIIGHKKYKAAKVVPVLISRDIASLPSGNYRLTVEVRNRALELLHSNSIDFQRSNPLLEMESTGVDEGIVKEEFVSKLTDEEVDYALRALAPVIPNEDVAALNSIIKRKDEPKAQRYFLFVYWAEKNPINPEEAYGKYMDIARQVDDKYSEGYGQGFESDRGYTYLKYGAPNDVVSVRNDPSAPPYEIWIYYDFPYTKQTNVKFLFYNANLAQYELLHSTARSEINNRNWQRDLYSRSQTQLQGANNVDATRVQDNWFRHADRYFNDF